MADRSALRQIGLIHGEEVRFKPHANRRWVIGRISGVEADGSICLHDPDGSARSLRPEALEVRRPGPRGRRKWRNVAEVATTWEQLPLF